MDIIQLTNLAYLSVALCMFAKKEPNASLVLFVFCVSTLHHYFPDKNSLQRLDGTIANISLIIILPYYLTKKQKTWHYWLSCEVFALSIYFYVMSGNDYKRQSYIMYHSAWHLLSALSLAIMLRAPNKT